MIQSKFRRSLLPTGVLHSLPVVLASISTPLNKLVYYGGRGSSYRWIGSYGNYMQN